MNWKELFNYENGNLFWKIQRQGRAKKGSKAGYLHHRGYLIVKAYGVLRPVHRIIWEMHNGPIPQNMEIDHINRIKLDNRLENLRLATRRQNACNISTNTSGVPVFTGANNNANGEQGYLLMAGIFILASSKTLMTQRQQE
ncbi:HNH endonuclease signature motif containing protein [Escherichia coli]